MIYLDKQRACCNDIVEDGSDAIDRLLADHPYAATSRLAYPEILSALNRKRSAAADITSRPRRATRR